MDRSGTVVLLSGGVDSALALDMAADEYSGPLHTVHATYGQQTATIERVNAKRQADHYATTHHTVDLSGVVGQYAEGVAEAGAEFGDQTLADGRSTGYVPMRNLTLLAVAAGFADAHGLERVVYGAQGGDHADYPDCRPRFVVAVADAIAQSVPEEDAIRVEAPLIKQSKEDVVTTAVERGVRLEWTYSCYAATDPNNPTPCGECPACVERSAAFESVGVADPIRD
jgi:7-cyano-7-deazaguanine synthase